MLSQYPYLISFFSTACAPKMKVIWCKVHQCSLKIWSTWIYNQSLPVNWVERSNSINVLSILFCHQYLIIIYSMPGWNRACKYSSSMFSQRILLRRYWWLDGKLISNWLKIDQKLSKTWYWEILEQSLRGAWSNTDFTQCSLFAQKVI